MSHVILVNTHERTSQPQRTMLSTCETALNVSMIEVITRSTHPKYPGTSILLSNGGVIMCADDEAYVWESLREPIFVESSEEFMTIEHWEHSEVDLIWMPDHRVLSIPSSYLNFWNRS